jgi:hypothetical protein
MKRPPGRSRRPSDGSRRRRYAGPPSEGPKHADPPSVIDGQGKQIRRFLFIVPPCWRVKSGTRHSITRAKGLSNHRSAGSALAIAKNRHFSRFCDGRLAQWESASLTRKRSHVQSMYRPPSRLDKALRLKRPNGALFFFTRQPLQTETPCPVVATALSQRSFHNHNY